MTQSEATPKEAATDAAAESPTEVTPFELIGGEARVRELVDRFYDLMDMEPSYKELRATHGATLDNARDKLFWFLCGWLGGPAYYFEKIGHPMLRARHLPFRIGIVERDQWVACMMSAMEQIEVPADLAEKLAGAFFNTADWMRNQKG